MLVSCFRRASAGGHLAANEGADEDGLVEWFLDLRPLSAWCDPAMSCSFSCQAAGVTVLGETNQQTEALMNVAWLGGSFTFAILLGVVTEDITGYFEVRAPEWASCRPAVWVGKSRFTL